MVMLTILKSYAQIFDREPFWLQSDRKTFHRDYWCRFDIFRIRNISTTLVQSHIEIHEVFPGKFVESFPKKMKNIQ